MTIAFEPWPKIARLNRDIVITEKIDGTNAAVVILPLGGTPAAEGAAQVVDNIHPDVAQQVGRVLFDNDAHNATCVVFNQYVVFAQSRTRFITPGKSTDNYGFAGWVRDNAEALVHALGIGRHFGEWYGSGIQRGYGLTGGEKRFALFNVGRWAEDADRLKGLVPNLEVVPVLYEGPFRNPLIADPVENAIRGLVSHGSQAVLDFDRPEGVVVYHKAAQTSFKVLLENDDVAKGQVAA